MAQIKVLKIGSEGFPNENESADDLTLNSFTASLAGGINVTGGVAITNDITFTTPGTDTINGIVADNLLDKTANETISGNYTIQTGSTLTIADAPTQDTHAANKAYVDSAVTGLDWQDSVLDKDLTAPPGSPTTGDRYIVGASATGAWAGQDNNIAEWNGTAWVFTTSNEGFAAWVEDEDKIYVYNGTAWVPFSNVAVHNNLSGLQGGNGSTEYYHMTAAEDTWLAAVVADIDATNVADLSDNETVTGDWTFTGTQNFNGGDLVLPGAPAGAPTEGDVYWDGSNDILYVYNGTAYVDVTSSGSATNVQTTYTAGTGGIAQYDAVYISSADTVLKADASALSTAKIIGFAPSVIAQATQGAIQEDGVLGGILSGAVPGDVYFLSETAGLISTSRPTTSGSAVIKVGYAKNATDLHIQIQFIGIRS